MPPRILDIERMGSPPRANEVVYPESDGKPMADNTKQFRYIATLKGGFDAYYKDRDDVFVAGDLLWYPVEGDNKTRYAPDVMIAFGRPPGDRGSYLQWRENGRPPDVVFEVLSPRNTKREMERKLRAYERFGAREYYVYDPDRGTLEGWLRDDGSGGFQAVEDMQGWTSPLCGVTFHLEGAHLVVTRPDGKVFLTASEMDDALESAEARADAERQCTETERQRADAERQRADAERQRADAERQRAEAERQRAAELEARLRALGVDPSA